MVTKTPRLMATAIPLAPWKPMTLVRKEGDGNQDPKLEATAALARFQTPTTLSGKGQIMPQMVSETPKLPAKVVPARFRTPATLVQREADGNQDPKTGGDGRFHSLPDITDRCPERGRCADGNPRPKTGGNGRSCSLPDTSDPCPERGRWSARPKTGGHGRSCSLPNTNAPCPERGRWQMRRW